MKDRRFQIEEALRSLKAGERAADFEALAWPWPHRDATPRAHGRSLSFSHPLPTYTP